MPATPVPNGFPTVTPYLYVADAAAAIDFYRRAFNARESYRLTMPNGSTGHAELFIGDSPVMLADESPAWGNKGPMLLGGTTVGLCLYVDDVDGDGRKDILIGGNQYRVKPEIGRFDAGYGALFSGTKDRQFSFVPFSQSGIHIRGEIRDIKKLSVAGKPRIMVLRNNDYPIILEKQ